MAMHLPHKRRRLLLVALAPLAAVGAAAFLHLSGTSSTPLLSRRAEIEGRLSRGEGQQLWNEIVDTPEWEPFLAQVQAGELGALQLAVLLCDVADTHPGEEMFEALATALSSSPEWLLKNAKRCRVGLRTICSWPTSEYPPNREASVASLEARATAVRNLDGPGIKEERAECLAEIEKLLALARSR